MEHIVLLPLNNITLLLLALMWPVRRTTPNTEKLNTLKLRDKFRGLHPTHTEGKKTPENANTITASRI